VEIPPTHHQGRQSPPISTSTPQHPTDSVAPLEPKMENRPLRILSLDGGGVRGLSILFILQKIMEQIRREIAEESQQSSEKPQLSTPLPCEYFDLICGSSTGGLIALMIGRLRMVVQLDLYLANARLVCRRCDFGVSATLSKYILKPIK
jgi:Patatin-like phospholipase